MTGEIGIQRCDLREVGARDRRLAVGDAAVVDGHGVGNQDSETPAFKLACEELEQKSVHEHTARERDGVEAFTSADLACDAGRHTCDGDVEVEREPAGGHAGPGSLQKRLKKRFGVQNMAVVWTG